MSYFAITSNHPRHVKFLETLYDHIDVPLVIVVDKGPITQEEADYFNSNLSLLHRTNILRCSKHQLHSNFVLQSLSKMDSKVGFVFGAPLLRKEIFELPEYGCVNIHTGMVNHYRGVDSSLWAMHIIIYFRLRQSDIPNMNIINMTYPTLKTSNRTNTKTIVR